MQKKLFLYRKKNIERNKMSTRTFTVIGITSGKGVEKGKEFHGGLYHGKSPINAVKKAATRICKAMNLNKQCVLIIKIREITRGSKNKEYIYKVKRFRTDIVVTKGDVEIEFKYKIKATSLNQFNTLKKKIA